MSERYELDPELPLDGGAIYGVTLHFFGGGDRTEIFSNESAFTRASEFFESAKDDPEVYDLWLTRGEARSASTFVARVGRRSRDGEWEPIPYAEDFIDPEEEAEV
jgi:hypothetical protein